MLGVPARPAMAQRVVDGNCAAKYWAITLPTEPEAPSRTRSNWTRRIRHSAKATWLLAPFEHYNLKSKHRTTKQIPRSTLWPWRRLLLRLTNKPLRELAFGQRDRRAEDRSPYRNVCLSEFEN